MINSQWSIINENGDDFADFDSFLDIDVRDEGLALSYPVEEGSFANYNKVQNPLQIHITLAKQGTNSEFEFTLSQLDEYQKTASKLSIVTPSAFYESTTLESHSYKRTRENGSHILIVEAVFVEVREVQTQVTTNVVTRPRNATSSNDVNSGKAQSETGGKYKSVLAHLGGAE